jgi:hypothetical protein
MTDRFPDRIVTDSLVPEASSTDAVDPQVTDDRTVVDVHRCTVTTEQAAAASGGTT